MEDLALNCSIVASTLTFLIIVYVDRDRLYKLAYDYLKVGPSVR